MNLRSKMNLGSIGFKSVNLNFDIIYREGLEIV